ncbi:MAG: VOC family protein [bacterium]|nr:VOC family protein [bacterium]
MVLNDYETFIREILEKLNKLGIDVSDLNMDHIGYQASSDEDYDRLKTEFDKIGEKVAEEIVGGRRVGFYRLHSPLRFRQYTNTAIELFTPKEGQICPSALEHVEFTLKESFESFMRRYPNVPWDTSVIGRPDFPMIKLEVDKNVQVKFHLTPVLEIIKPKREAKK